MSLFDRIKTMIGMQAVRPPALAYCVACCAAVTVIVLVGLSTMTFGIRVEFADIAWAIPYFVVFVAALALIPTVLAAVLLRTTHLQRGLAETAVGALIGLLVSSAYLIAINGSFAVLHLIFPAPAAAFGIAGAVAGLSYWLALGCPKNPRLQDRRNEEYHGSD